MEIIVFCSYCGAANDHDSKFCASCGKEIGLVGMEKNNAYFSTSAEKNNYATGVSACSSKSQENRPIIKQSYWARYKKWTAEIKADPIKWYGNNVKLSIAIYYLNCLLVPYATVQVTLFGEGRKESVYSLAEPMFLAITICATIAWFLCIKGRHLYNTGLFFLLFILAVIRMSAAYSVEAGFGTKIEVSMSSVFHPIFWALLGGLWSYKAHKINNQ